MNDMIEAISPKMADRVYEGQVHASSVVIEGKAVLICGPSGAGKSDLALRLIDRGALLLCDDYINVACEDGTLVGRPCQNIEGMIELRGVGLIHLPHTQQAPIALIVRLLEPTASPPERLPETQPCQDLCGIQIPVLSLHGFEASAPLKIELALKKYSDQNEAL